ncbi:Ig-like domain-containing protein [Bradyrhizobium sp. MOS002]|uniref:Ig-like domain-containing protein n=1 Tax=Bradyrhizobium sp. MOS002 TaxID=2133947 RepID=UPI000D12EAEB|nr:Ig-like domain-containing protein [Bradyrhizobium sp. MOS002]PSO25977.1 hypothetical protein C7G41_28775 [Bradyrhizobium sp. MOS002]
MRRSARSSDAAIVSPTITSVSPDTNISGDGITDANFLICSGTAAPNTQLSIFDGAILLGPATSNATGLWTFTTGLLVDGVHNVSATVTSTSASSNVEKIVVDAAAPIAPTITHENILQTNQAALSGTSEANSKLIIYDDTVQLGTTMTDSSGAWTFTASPLTVGPHTFTATAMDLAGNVSAASSPIHQQVIAIAQVSALPITEPDPAATANYNKLVFDDEFNSYSSIDMSNSQTSSSNWYLSRWFWHGTDATDSSDVSIVNGVLQLGGAGDNGNVNLVSGFDNSSGGFTGNSFANGAYFEASIRYDPSLSPNAAHFPAFFALPTDILVDPYAQKGISQWTGQPTGYTHFVEVDFMESMIPGGAAYDPTDVTTLYQGNVHDFSGTWGSSGFSDNIKNALNDVFQLNSVNWNTFHTYGLLWVPQSGTTPGHVTWFFDGEAMASIYWLGPAVSPNLSGAFTGSFTPSSPDQAATTYSVLDSQSMAISLQADPNWPMYVDWVRVWQNSSSPTSSAISAPIITSYSPDSGAVGDGITNAKIIVLNGTAGANTVELIYDGSNWLGSATADASGAWKFATTSLTDGSHTISAVSTDTAGHISATSAALIFRVDAFAPTIQLALSQDTGPSSHDVITSSAQITGSGDPNAAVSFSVDGHAASSSVMANSAGIWTCSLTGLQDGTHTILASEVDIAGNTGTASLTFTLDTVAPSVTIGAATLSNGNMTLMGTAAETGDRIAIYDGNTLCGTTIAGTEGKWTFTTINASASHSYSVTATDIAGNVGSGSNEALIGSNKGDVLVGSSGNDILLSNGGNVSFTGRAGADSLFAGDGNDTFIYSGLDDSTASSHDTIFNFDHVHDTILFSGIAGIAVIHGVPAFQGQLSGSTNLSLQAHNIGYVEVGGNTEVVINTTNATEVITASDVQSANMMIVLTGIHLGLTGSDFHLV